MKILFIVPGSGFTSYCGNCFRDSLYAASLRKAGCTVIIMPLYLPFNNKDIVGDTPLFFPATTFYAEQQLLRGKRTPLWLSKMIGAEKILGFASSLSGTTSAKGTEKMTHSMLTGGNPSFNHQIDEMMKWIESDRPDIIHLSSTLLIGIAKSLKQRVDIPIVCSLQDEDVWIESMNEQDASLAWKEMESNICFVDRFVTTSQYYKSYVLNKMSSIKEVDVVYPGINKEKYDGFVLPEKPTIGFFYRMNYLDGLDILADAFIKLKKRQSINGLRLKIGGGYSNSDKKFVRSVRKKLKPYEKDVIICEDYNPDKHSDFYKDISLISVPIRFEESVGLYLCEAFAAGRPAVEPAKGSFNEIIGQAGLTYNPEGSSVLADTIEKILLDSELYNTCVSEASKLSSERYSDEVASKRLINIYKEVLLNKNRK